MSYKFFNFTSIQLAAISVAAGLNEGDDRESCNEEYVRGQAELICDLFGIDMGEVESVIDAILTAPSILHPLDN